MKRMCWLALVAAMALTSVAEEKESSVAAEYERVSKEYEQAEKEFSEAYQKATEEQREKLKYPSNKDYALRMIGIAEKNPKEPGALNALLWVTERAYHDQNAMPKALALLGEHHIESDKLERACQVLAYGDLNESKGFLARVLEKNPHDNVKGAASLSLGRMALRDDSKAAENYFTDVVEKYGTKRQKEQAKGELFEMHNLAIGKVAPEIEGEDVDGKKFKLSDYRGKVVVIDFWGDW